MSTNGKSAQTVRQQTVTLNKYSTPNRIPQYNCSSVQNVMDGHIGCTIHSGAKSISSDPSIFEHCMKTTTERKKIV